MFTFFEKEVQAEVTAEKHIRIVRKYDMPIAVIMYFFLCILFVLMLTEIYSKSHYSGKGFAMRQFITGAVMTIPAAAIEYVLGRILNSFEEQIFLFSWMVWGYNAVAAGLSEEGMKIIAVKSSSGKENTEDSDHYKYILTAVNTGLGFSVLETIMYAAAYGGQSFFNHVAMTMPMHICCAVLMGYYYGNWKINKHIKSRYYAYAIPVMVHAGYDFLIHNDTPVCGWIAIAMVVVMEVSVRKKLRGK